MSAEEYKGFRSSEPSCRQKGSGRDLSRKAESNACHKRDGTLSTKMKLPYPFLYLEISRRHECKVRITAWYCQCSELPRLFCYI
ncbi:hypothetical protein ACFX14_028998 [Malus domestica]